MTQTVCKLIGLIAQCLDSACTSLGLGPRIKKRTTIHPVLKILFLFQCTKKKKKTTKYTIYYLIYFFIFNNENIYNLILIQDMRERSKATTTSCDARRIFRVCSCCSATFLFITSCGYRELVVSPARCL